MRNDVLKILMLEDIEEDAGLVDRVLRKENLKFIRTRVDNREEFASTLDSFIPDLILSDHSMPQFNSIEALKICQEKRIDVPFILVTGAVSEEFAVSCLRMGAMDYVLKTNLSRLPQAIQHALDKYWNEKNKIAQEIALRRQNEELIKINKELDAFVYRVSHDLRSPISSILGLTGLARLDGYKSEAQALRYFEMIDQNVVRLDGTLREILDYYRNARGELILEEINIEKIIQMSFENLKFIKGFDRIKQIVNIEQKMPLQSDSYRWSVIISNLISNAIHYRDDTKPQQLVNVSVAIEASQAVLEVRDNGIGIQEEQVPKVLDMFYRATEKSRGAGLGLYIVREMVEKLNGQIAVTSRYGEETVVTVTIPNSLEEGSININGLH